MPNPGSAQDGAHPEAKTVKARLHLPNKSSNPDIIENTMKRLRSAGKLTPLPGTEPKRFAGRDSASILTSSEKETQGEATP